MKKKIKAPVEFKIDGAFPTILSVLDFITQYDQALRRSIGMEEPPPAVPAIPDFTPVAGQNYFRLEITIVLPARDLVDMLVTLRNGITGATRNHEAEGKTGEPFKIEIDIDHWGKWTLSEIVHKKNARDDFKAVRWTEHFHVPNRAVLISALREIANDSSGQKNHLSDYLPDAGNLLFTAELRTIQRNFPRYITNIASSLENGSFGSSVHAVGDWSITSP